MDFWNENKDMINERYKSLVSIEIVGGEFRQKGYAYCTTKDYIYEKGLTATDCQINKMAELIVFGFESEDNKKREGDVDVNEKRGDFN